MTGPCILTHDIGTTGNKAVLFDVEKEQIISSMYFEYSTFYPKSGWAEQNPQDWWNAFKETTKQILKISKIKPDDVSAISFSGQMMGCMPVDKQGKPLTSSIIWMDQRSIKESELIKQKIGEEKFYKITGNRNSPTYPIAKILWVKNNMPQIYEKAYKFLQSKDFIVCKLTGQFLTDFSDASLTGMFDVNRRQWSHFLLETLNIDSEKLPDIYPSTHVAGEISGEVAKELNLNKGIPVVVGGGDGACATAGAGVIEVRETYNYIGASSWVATCTETPFFDPDMRTFNMWHLDKNKLLIIGTMQAAGASYRWLRDEICKLEKICAENTSGNVYNILDSKAAKVPPGSEKLVFLPYLMGERAPWWNPYARGVFFGLSLSHGRDHLIRSVLEGVTFNLKIIVDILEELVGKIEDIRVIGGGARSRLWRQILADIFGKNILVPRFLEEATAVGAAIAGGIGVKIFRDFNVVHKIVCTVEKHVPNNETHKKYELLYEFFKKLYLTLVPLYKELGQIDV